MIVSLSSNRIHKNIQLRLITRWFDCHLGYGIPGLCEKVDSKSWAAEEEAAKWEQKEGVWGIGTFRARIGPSECVLRKILERTWSEKRTWQKQVNGPEIIWKDRNCWRLWVRNKFLCRVRVASPGIASQLIASQLKGVLSPPNFGLVCNPEPLFRLWSPAESCKPYFPSGLPGRCRHNPSNPCKTELEKGRHRIVKFGNL